MDKENELSHYGVQGMKWGVRHDKQYRLDNKLRKTLKRHVAADKKNVRIKGKMADSATSEYLNADSNYRKQLSRPAFNQRKKRERIEKANDELTKSGEYLEKSKKELHRANRIYEEDAKQYKNHVKKMISKYGNERVKDLKEKQYSLGNHYVKTMVKTGITIADIPVIGSYYTGNYVGQREYADRMALIDKKSKKRY